MDLEPKKKTLKELIKNAYKENKLIRDILAVLHERKGYKVRH
jgi:poly(3-hydroxyalkanoate) synthetase